MNLKELMTKMDFPIECCAVSSNGGSFQLREIEISPMEFLILAEDDLSAGCSSRSLNAITNAKRAIVSQMDQLLYSFGYSPFSWNIPKKIEKLQLLGLLLPPILRKVSLTRNLLEHEYRRPTIEEVESAIDIASLFVWGMSSLFNCFGDAIQFSCDTSFNEELSEYGKYISLGIHVCENGVAYIGYGHEKYKKKPNPFFEKVVISNEDPLFGALVGIAASYETGYRLEEALRSFELKYQSI